MKYLRLPRQTLKRPAAEMPSPLKGLENSAPPLQDAGEIRRFSFRKIDITLIFVLAMSMFAILPEVVHPGLFVGHDTLNHAFRVGEISRLWSQGILFPRWAETFYFGYGSPVFQYYAPLTYSISAGFMHLFGLDAVGALRLLVMVCLPAASVGMYLFMRAYAGKLAGILAALVYVYSPYIVFTEPVTRGDYPEMLCFALFPFVMWRLECLLQRGRARDFVFCALLIGVFALAHNLMSVLLLALLVGWLIWRKLFQNISWKQLRLGFASALLGAALAGFFWLPIFLQRNEVQLGNVPVNIQSEHEHLFGFFVPLNHLLALSPIEDAGAANGTLLRLNLGLAQWLLALTGLTGIIIQILKSQRKDAKGQRRKDERARHVVPLQNTIYFAVTALAMIGLMIPLAYGLWTGFPALNFLEFPWRLLGPIAFCLAALAGMNAEWIEKLPARFASVVTIIFMILPVLAALPTLYVSVNRLQNLDTSPAAYLRSETSGQTSPGTSARNDFLPYGVKVLPGATQSLIDDYSDGDTLVNKADMHSLPPSTSVTVSAHTPESETWHALVATPFALETYTFNFPGWRAEVDGQPAQITSSKPHGFIRIDVPAGDHIVRLFLTETPAQIAGIVVSLLAVVIVGVAGVRWPKEDTLYRVPTKPPGVKTPGYPFPAGSRLKTTRTRRETFADWDVRGLNERFNGIIGRVSSSLVLYSSYLITFVLTVLAAGLLMREGIAWVQSPPGTAQIAQHHTVYNLGDQIQVLGYDVSAETLRPGDWLEVVVYWYAKAKPEHNYSSFVHFSAGDTPLTQADKPYPAERATSEWTPGAYRRDEYSIHVPDGIAPGEYHLNLGLYTCDTRPAGNCGNGDRLPVTDADGNPLGDILTLTTLKVFG
ncbi:MAG: 6-pyruvoyl-tetrahydropterin synthase-related protein [Chloroflexota bacterium]